MNYIHLAQNIKNARKEKHYTQEQLAELVSCSTVFISQIETGVRVPSLETIYNISNVLNVTIDSLFSDFNNINKISSYTDEINKLLQSRTHKEIKFILNLVKTICSGLDEVKS